MLEVEEMLLLAVPSEGRGVVLEQGMVDLLIPVYLPFSL